MATLPAKICHEIHALVTGAGPQPHVEALNSRLKYCARDCARYLTDADGLLSGLWCYIEGDPRVRAMVDSPTPVAGVRKAWGQFLSKENEGMLRKKFYQRLGPLKGEIGLSKVSGHDARAVADVIAERFAFCVNPPPAHLADDVDVIQLVLYREDSSLDDPILRDEDLKRIGRHVVDALGAVDRSALTNGLAAVMPRGLHCPPRAEQADLDAPNGSEDKGWPTLGESMVDPNATSVDVDTAVAGNLAAQIWDDMTMSERFVWTGRTLDLRAKAIIAWCAACGVAGGPQNPQRESDTYGRIEKKLRKLAEACDDRELFTLAIASVMEGPMEQLQEENPPPYG